MFLAWSVFFGGPLWRAPSGIKRRRNWGFLKVDERRLQLFSFPCKLAMYSPLQNIALPCNEWSWCTIRSFCWLMWLSRLVFFHCGKALCAQCAQCRMHNPNLCWLIWQSSLATGPTISEYPPSNIDSLSTQKSPSQIKVLHRKSNNHPIKYPSSDQRSNF